MQLKAVSLRIEDDVLDHRWKGFPVLATGTTVSQFVANRPSLFDAGFSWPVATLRASAIDHNIGVLASWCQRWGISLAPHGKTTMAPALFARQLAAGAWGITAATPWHVRIYRAAGVSRILLANELVDLEFAQWLAAELAADPDFEFFCYVDSVRGVDELGDRLDAGWTAGSRPLAVLVEVGVEGGRTGARDASQVHDVATAVGRHPSLALVGVAGYEGPFGHDSDAATVAAVRGFVVSLADTLRDLDAKGLLDDAAREFILTCGGSGHVDAVTSVLAEPANCSRPVRAVLRSGAYVTHDDGLYAQTSSIAPQLQPAIEVWCQVLSRPEPGLALLGAGRRDLPFDSGMPIAKWRWATSSGSVTRLRAEVAEVVKLMDQHAFLELAPSEALEVGDLVGLGISHPCTAHDKWQMVPLLDDERRVIDCVRQYF